MVAPGGSANSSWRPYIRPSCSALQKGTGGAFLAFALLLTLPATARADIVIDGTDYDDHIFVFVSADPEYAFVITATDYGESWSCSLEPYDLTEYCGGGGTYLVDAGAGNDFVAFLFTNSPANTIRDERAAEDLRAVRAACQQAGDPIPNVDGSVRPASWLYGWCKSSEVHGGTGRDELRGSPGPEVMWGDEDSDGIFGRGGLDELHGGTGHDEVNCTALDGGDEAPCVAYGDANDDRIVGGNYTSGDVYADDDLIGGSGNDYILGGNGSDEIVGNGGSDWLFGQDGRDYLNGGTGDDRLSGGLNPLGIPDYLDGGTHVLRDEFVCRGAPFETPWDDPLTAVTDCDDGYNHKNIEREVEYSPRADWAVRWDQAALYRTTGDSIRTEFYTTSSVDVMNDDRVAGGTFLLQQGGAIPFAGCFRTEGCSHDGFAYFLPDTGEWVFDHDLNGVQDGDALSWAPTADWDEYRLSTIRPFVGDFDGDGTTDVGYFDPLERVAEVDVGLNGPDPKDLHYSLASFGPGDLPVAGSFRYTYKTDLLFYRPREESWFRVTSTSGSSVSLSGLAGLGCAGSMPIAIDGDADGLMEPALFSRREGVWEYWLTLSGTTGGAEIWRGTHARGYPIAGDFDGDGKRDDAGLVDPGAGTVELVLNLFGGGVLHEDDVWAFSTTVAAVLGDAEPLRSRRIQSDHTCGPQSLEMALRYRGLTEEFPPGWQLTFNRNLAAGLFQVLRNVGAAPWDPSHGDSTSISVGYRYSAEHIVYDALRQRVAFPPPDEPLLPGGACTYVTGLDLANATTGDTTYDSYTFRRMEDYGCGHADPFAVPTPPVPTVQVWDECSPGIGTSVGNENPLEDQGRGLEGVARRAQEDALGGPRTPDAHSLAGAPEGVADPDHFWYIVTSAIDHGMPLAVGVERGGHFNTIVGYSEPTPGARYIYTADPLDGALRPFGERPMRWQSFQVTAGLLASGLVGGLLVFDLVETGACVPVLGWAANIDAFYATWNGNRLCLASP